MADEYVEALSILERMNEENKLWEATNKARLQVGTVLKQAREAVKVLDELEVHKLTIEESIARLESRYDQGNDELQTRLLAARNAVNEEIASLEAQVAAVKEQTKNVVAEFETDKAMKESVISGLSIQIGDLTKEKADLLSDLTALKAKHGLGG